MKAAGGLSGHLDQDTYSWSASNFTFAISCCRCIRRRIHGSNVDGHGNGNTPGIELSVPV
ncbi:hypothetical protein V6Z11_D02G060500 [Gossypium hirsutum]